MCLKMTYNMFMFYEFDNFQTPENALNLDDFAKQLIKCQNQNILSILKN